VFTTQVKITKNGNKFQFQLYNSIATSTLVIPWSIVAKEMSIMGGGAEGVYV
jgi:hypothetical protein